MKLCIPVTADQGMNSPVSGHFGSAPMFVIHDTETGETSFTDNNNEHHAHGHCHPVGALDGQAVDAILVGGIGAHAVSRLAAAGIKVYRATATTLGDAVKAWQAGTLEQISDEGACAHHGGCAH
jgi:predicted Fe-Mo cluster-binding NifX family protein